MVIRLLIIKGSLDFFYDFFLYAFTDIRYLFIGNSYSLARNCCTFCRGTLRAPHAIGQ